MANTTRFEGDRYSVYPNGKPSETQLFYIIKSRIWKLLK